MVDYKSGKPPSAPGVGDENIVLALYIQAAQEKGAATRGARLEYVLDGEFRVFDPDPGELVGLVGEAQDLADRAASGDFEPTPGFHCRSCDYQLLCPARDR
jgi:putative RecB family exonuclease